MTLWLPETKAYDAILNRAESEAHVTKNLAPIIEVLTSLVDYGTHLIPRCWVSSDRALREMVVLGVLLKHVIAQIDAGSELLRLGCVDPAFLQLRSAYESSVYVDWVLGARNATRAKAYYVWNIRRAIRWNKRALSGTPESDAIKKEMAGLNVIDRFASLESQDNLKSEIKRLTEHLDRPKWRPWNLRFDKKKGKKPYDPSWYEVLFKRRISLYTIAGLVGRQPEYRTIYEVGSEAMHGSRSDAHVRVIEAGRLSFRSLRDLSDFGFVSQMFIGIALKSYQRVLKAYRPDEAPNFARKYLEEWQKGFLTRVTVNYQYKYAEIS